MSQESSSTSQSILSPFTYNSQLRFYAFAYAWMSLNFSLWSQDSLSVHAQVTKHLYTFLKFAGLLALVSMFYLSQVFFEKIFVTRPWKEEFRSQCHIILTSDWSPSQQHWLIMLTLIWLLTIIGSLCDHRWWHSWMVVQMEVGQVQALSLSHCSLSYFSVLMYCLF